MSPIEKRGLSLGELEFKIEPQRVLELAVHYRFGKLSWPVAIAEALTAYSSELVGENSTLNQLLMVTYYQNFLRNIRDTEIIIENGPTSSSELILALTNNPIEQAKIIAEDRDTQHKAAQALIDDTSGISLLAIKLQDFVKVQTLNFNIDPTLNIAVGVLTRYHMKLSQLTHLDPLADEGKAGNLRTYAYMKAFDDFRKTTETIKDQLPLIDKKIYELD